MHENRDSPADSSRAPGMEPFRTMITLNVGSKPCIAIHFAETVLFHSNYSRLISIFLSISVVFRRMEIHDCSSTPYE